VLTLAPPQSLVDVEQDTEETLGSKSQPFEDRLLLPQGRLDQGNIV